LRVENLKESPSICAMVFPCMFFISIIPIAKIRKKIELQ
jgi:hypothetical protein